MALLAKRVSAWFSVVRMASISYTPRARAASSISPNISSFRIRASYLNVAESRRAGPMARAHHLLGLPLTAIRNAPQCPVVRSGNGRARIPELGGDATVARVLQHAHPLAVADLPTDLAAELEVVPLVVDRPAAVRLHIDAVVYIEDFIE